MFVVRPVVHNFLFWVLLAPVFFVEAYALNQLFQVLALQDAARTQHVSAAIVEQRTGTSTPEIRYEFRVPGRAETFSATSMNVVGRANIWVAVNQASLPTNATDHQVDVIYLPENPWINQPVGRAGYPVSEQFCTWGVFLIIDLLWLGETVLIVRNYGRALAAAERRETLRVRFWRSMPVLR